MILLFFLITRLAFSLKPIFFIPCLTCAPLYANITQPDLYPECPKNFVQRKFWPIDGSLQSQYPNCYGTLIDSFYDEQSGEIKSLPGIKIYTDPFGEYGSQGSFVPLANKLISSFGYQKNVNLFGCLYDWIHYPYGINDFVQLLISKIEEAVKNNNEKAVLLGQSLGTHFVRIFLNEFTTKEWQEKYIDRAIMTGPASYGCFNPFDEFARGWFSSLTVTEKVKDAAHKMTSCSTLTLNYVAGKDTVIFKNASIVNKETGKRENKDLYPKDIKNYLIQEKALEGNSLKIFERIEHTLSETPKEFIVPTLVIYNSGIKTDSAFDASEGFTKLKYITGKGDGTCDSMGADYICDHWSNIKCFDAKSSDGKYSHMSMINADDNMKRIIEFIDNNQVNVPKRRKIVQL